VVAGLVTIFMEQANASNRADMGNAQKFLNQQITSYEVQLRKAEQRRAEFRRKYLDILPLESNGGVSRLDTARIAVRDLEAQIEDAKARRQALQEEARITPPAIDRALGAARSSPDQIAAAEAKLSELKVRFTDQHPDVITARQLVESLKAAPRRGQSAPLGDSTPSTSTALPNPVYEQVKLRLIEAEGGISSLQSRLDTAR